MQVLSFTGRESNVFARKPGRRRKSFKRFDVRTPNSFPPGRDEGGLYSFRDPVQPESRPATDGSPTTDREPTPPEREAGTPTKPKQLQKPNSDKSE